MSTRTPPSRRIFRSVGAAFLAAALAGAAAAAEAPTSRAPETRLVGVVNVNTATAEQLELLPGIGPARATAIIEYRKANGGFEKVSDLVGVSGIGDRALDRIRAHCAVKGKTTAKLER